MNNSKIKTSNPSKIATKVQCETLPWENAQAIVKNCHPQLFHLLNNINPTSKHQLIRVRYPFGVKIVQEGQLHLPTQNGELIPVNHPDVPKDLQSALSYQNIPLGILLNNSMEVFRELNNGIFSLALLGPGLDLGIYETFAENICLDVCSGARSLYLLPKATDTQSHKNLKQFYGIKVGIPQTLFDQWEIFKAIVNHRNFSESWSCDILFLNDEWLKPIDTYAWSLFHKHLLQTAWEHTRYSRNKFLIEFIWKDFSELMSAKDVRPRAYIEKTLRHLIYLALGYVPGLAPVNPSFVTAPIDALQQVYLDVYKLKTYVPTILQPCYFSLDVNQPVYYALQLPTIVAPLQNLKNQSAADDLRELKELLDLFLQYLPKLWSHNDTYIIKVLNAVKFDFFHSEAHTYGGIHATKEMPKQDPSLMMLPNHYPDREFCYRNTVVRGCVKISRK